MVGTEAAKMISQCQREPFLTNSSQNEVLGPRVPRAENLGAEGIWLSGRSLVWYAQGPEFDTKIHRDGSNP